ncbi:MAG: HNH endonuclease [Bacteroidota bacterium]|nr:HNH endonuclease [Bacteroidota bacterium]
MSLPPSYAKAATNRSDRCWAGFAPATGKRLSTAHVKNGLLLRSDIHKLFDTGYVTVNPDYQFEVSDRIHTEFNNGKQYYKLQGTKLWIPEHPEEQPDRQHLEWHNENRFRG